MCVRRAAERRPGAAVPRRSARFALPAASMVKFISEPKAFSESRTGGPMRAWARLPLILLICGMATMALGADGAASWLELSSPVPATARVDFSAGAGRGDPDRRGAGGSATCSGPDPGPGIPAPRCAGSARSSRSWTARTALPNAPSADPRSWTSRSFASWPSSWREVSGRPLPSKGNLSREIDPASVPWSFGDAYGPSAAGCGAGRRRAAG